ncbi:hypothetical protein [Rhodopirellula sp. MGV]|uniref:hypothetical protein n=1 Tax=Rhodopirellula sp. MGV TaxID=2023130 RepID=UPI000BC44B42|nr:hypothetical protein [Rhodopirellula sp. MGV]OYP33985.1 hypothetical protein CGZ80_17585 [Rhodopirellula sp. MGV]
MTNALWSCPSCLRVLRELRGSPVSSTPWLVRGRLGRWRQADAWQPIAITSTALLSTIQDNPTPDVPTASLLLVTLRRSSRVNLSSAAYCKLSSRVDREQLDAREPPSCVQ